MTDDANGYSAINLALDDSCKEMLVHKSKGMLCFGS